MGDKAVQSKRSRSGRYILYTSLFLSSLTLGLSPLQSSKLVQDSPFISQLVGKQGVAHASSIVTVNKDNFAQYFDMNGSAKNNYDSGTGVQTLTNDSWQAGNVAFKGTINANSNFEIAGAINLGKELTKNKLTGIADGIGFVFYQGAKDQVGGTGGDLGIYGVPNAFGWKVDTWNNYSNRNEQVLQGDYDDGHTAPYGTFISTDGSGHGTIDQSTAVNLNKAIDDDQFHKVTFVYTASTHEFKIVLNTPSGDVTFSKTLSINKSDPAYMFTISSSTGVLPTNQQFRLDEMKYTPIQQATVQYIDDDENGRVISSNDVTGENNAPIGYSSADKISYYKSKGYELVSDGTQGAKFDSDDATNQTFKVHLKHTHTKTTNTKKVTETVHYKFGNGDKAHDDYVASPKTFTQVADKDNVTGDTSYSDWSTNDGNSFGQVNSPNVSGYTPDQANIPVQNVNQDSGDIVKTVTYSPNKEYAKVTYVDDTTGKTLKTDNLNGNFGTTDGYSPQSTITGYENSGYKLTKSDFPDGGVKYDQDGVTKSYTVHLEHKTITVDPEHPQQGGTPINPKDPNSPKWDNGLDPNTLTHVVHQTVNYVDSNGVPVFPAVKDSTTLEHTVVYDQVTGKQITDQGWKANGGKTTFTTKVSPKKTGYTPDKVQIPAVTGITEKTPDINDFVTYTPNDEKAEVTFYDDTTGKVLTTKDLAGKYGETDKYRDGSDVTRYTDSGYALVSDDYPKDGVVYNKDGVDQKFSVHLKHKTITINPNNPQTSGQPINPNDPNSPKWGDGDTYDALTKTLTDIIHYKKADGTKVFDDVKQSVGLGHQLVYDRVTGKVIEDDGWSPLDKAKDSFAEKDSPKLTGYTPDKAKVAGVDQVTDKTGNLETTVTYKPDPEVADMLFVDDTANTKLSKKDLQGDFGTVDAYRATPDVKHYEQLGYKLVRNNYPNDGVKYNQTKPQSFEAHFVHGENQQVVTKQVKETVHYIYQGGKKAHDDYNASPLGFTQTVVTDKATGKKTYSKWFANNGTSFKEVGVPEIKGYKPNVTKVEEVKGINQDTPNVVKTVVYTKIPLVQRLASLPQTGEGQSIIVKVVGVVVLVVAGLLTFLGLRTNSKGKHS